MNGRSTVTRGLVVSLVATALAWNPGVGQHRTAPAVPADSVTLWMLELSNRGRWGADDQMGTLNLVTPDVRRAAAALVEAGIAVSLSRELSKTESIDNPSPIGHEMRKGAGAAMDAYVIDYHGYAYTHLDGLSHIFPGGQMYNGYSADEVTTRGAGRLGVEQMADGIVTRGVLVDIPALRDVPYLDPLTVLLVADLEAWEARSGVTIGSGDALLLYTGRWRRRDELGPWPASDGLPGLHPSVARWLHEREVAVLGCDCVSDPLPSRVDGVAFPLHQLAIAAMGMPLLDNLDLEAAAVEARARSRWTFLLTVAPLRVPGGTGSPVNPTAVF